jgi:rRNA maturation endonuclease Nob1
MERALDTDDKRRVIVVEWVCPRCEARFDESGFCSACGEDFAGTQSRESDDAG